MRLLADLIAPLRCVSCGASSDGDLCAPCAHELVPIAGPICLRCGTPMERRSVQVCPACRDHDGYAAARSLLVYRGPAGRLALALKRRGRHELARHAGGLLADLATAYGLADERLTVTFVPAGREADRRGYDHAELLARGVAEKLAFPCERWLARSGDGPRQSEVPLHRRAENAARRFRAVRVRGRILLVDDIFTTGATVQACSSALMRAGAKRVDVITLARTPRLRPAAGA